MAKYCLDTSGFSNPILDMPDDIHMTLWTKVRAMVEDGLFCWNEEIAVELNSIPGDLGQTLQDCHEDCCHEIGSNGWPWQEYLEKVEELRIKYNQYISEYNGNRKNTVGLNDVSIIALAIVLNLPIVSMEKPNGNPSSEKRMRIPEVCTEEGVKHLWFNDLMRAEGITA